MLPMAGLNKTVVLESGSEFRPGPPPDFTKEMEEMKNYKQTFRSLSNAFYWANQSWFTDYFVRKTFETNLFLNPPRIARLQAIINVASYDGFIACWDAKYTYWGIRPNQYDTTYKSLITTPPFPGYPSGHAMGAGTSSAVLEYFFPADAKQFRKLAQDCADSRFYAGIHFRTDNETALNMGRELGKYIVDTWMKQ